MKRKKFNYYKYYTRKEMSRVGKEEGLVYVKTTGDIFYVISQKDIPDFIMRETQRRGNNIEISVYVPNSRVEEPLVTTHGHFLNQVKPKYREVISDRLTKLQTNEIKPRKIKVFDDDLFMQMDDEEFGEGFRTTKQYDKFFKKYYEDEQEWEA